MMSKEYFPYSTTILCGSLIGFFGVSKIVFDKVFLTSTMIIDEEFHIPQGLAYCNLSFKTWNPKITTLPGLYLISTVVLKPFDLCSVYSLRFINLVAAVFNFFLINLFLNTHNKMTPWLNLLSSINLSLLPPLYFFNNLYYTDVVSMTFILLLIIFHKNERHLLASIFGIMGVIIRQTNIIWVIMLFGQYVMKESILKGLKQPKKHMNSGLSWDNILNIITEMKNKTIIRNVIKSIWVNAMGYLLLLIGFAIFIFINGSIVVGDKTAHTASIHFPQILYFSLFCLIFSWPYFLTDIFCFLCHIQSRKMVALILTVLIALIVYFNTLEHPYLLADNRHYTFYIWNRLYRKFYWFRYVMIPVYYFAIYSLFLKLNISGDITFNFPYIICSCFVLILQKLIEIRYFLIPFVILRLQYKKVTLCQLILEFLSYCIINSVTFYIFFTKDVYWLDFDYAQKIIW